MGKRNKNIDAYIRDIKEAATEKGRLQGRKYVSPLLVVAAVSLYLYGKAKGSMRDKINCLDAEMKGAETKLRSEVERCSREPEPVIID
ncbi:MAG: hypothetical protein MJ105_06680 [Lachnospiraceae bacterium]|nr:hypothetical protein [Lachnospiraceae bacterium]